MDERKGDNAQFVERLVTRDGFTLHEGLRALAEHVTERDRADAEWGLLVIEFRVHAARNPELNRRYGEVHERTVAGVAGVVARIYDRAIAQISEDAARTVFSGVGV